jgi:uncharacterized membrane protein YhhN
MKANTILNSYLIFSILYLLLPFVGLDTVNWYLKPFLLPFLLVTVLISADFQGKKLLLSALLFSWIGDIILMFADKAEIYFILGLVSFLLSHILYIVLFSRQPKTAMKGNSIALYLGTILILGYFFGMVGLLFPKLGPLQIPVMVYAAVITTMLFVACKGSLTWEKPAAYSILAGAIFFVLSDSILAINKFYHPIAQSGFWIMSTYILAQYLIVSGILRLNKKSSLS